MLFSFIRELGYLRHACRGVYTSAAVQTQKIVRQTGDD